MNAYRDHLKEEASFAAAEFKAATEALIAVMCDQKARTIPAIIRAIREMNGHELSHQQIKESLDNVRSHGWSMMKIFGIGATEYLLVKA